MRVITGTARGRKLQTLPGLDVRPTTDMVKEAMFSIVQFEVEGAMVLDLFAGSGQLGIEALSRGAQRCIFCDQNPQAVEVIKSNCKAAGVFRQSLVVQMEARALLAGTKEQFDLALLDPPYRRGTLADILPLVAEVMAPNGTVLCESEPQAVLPEQAGTLVLKKQYRYGTVLVSRYQNESGEESE